MQAPDAETNTLRDFPAAVVSASAGQQLRAAGAVVGTTVVLHEDQLAEVGMWTFQNVYASDLSGVHYSLALKNVQNSPDMDVRGRFLLLL